MIPHHWKRSAEQNQTSDPNGQPKRGSYANQVLGIIRGLMTTAAAARDDHIGELVAALGAKNVYAVTSNEGLIDISTTGPGQTPAILTPFLLRTSFDTALTGTAANPAMLAADGAVKVPLLRWDASPLRDGDIVTGRPYLVLGDMAASTDTTVTQARILDDVPSLVADLALATGVGRRNRIADPGFQVSQLNGSTALPLVSGTPGYPSDTVYADFQGATGGATVQRIAGPTPSGSPFWHRLTITGANPNPGISDRLRYVIPGEGQDIADLLFGTANAKTVNFALDVRMPAGSYGIAIRNGKAATRAWLGSFTVSASENQVGVTKSLTIPGDIAGAWASDNSRALEISISVLAGTALQASAGWAGGDYMAPTLNAANGALSNGMASAGATFDIGAPRFTQGTAAQAFELPVYEESLRRCRRWLRKVTRFSGITDLSGGIVYALIELDQPMRVQPAVTISAPLKVIIPGLGYFTQSNTGTFPDFSGDASTGVILQMQNFTGLPNNTPCQSYLDQGQYVLFNARL